MRSSPSYETILIFWCEALIIGAYNVLRLLLVGLLGERPLGETVARWVEFSPGFRVLATAVGTAFFACKFGMFALGVGLLVVALPAFSAPPGSGGSRVFMGLTAAGPGVAAAVAERGRPGHARRPHHGRHGAGQPGIGGCAAR